MPTAATAMHNPKSTQRPGNRFTKVPLPQHSASGTKRSEQPYSFMHNEPLQ
jgi:hypothetical protein